MITCRNCGKKPDGGTSPPYTRSGSKTLDWKYNFYGGWVCSYTCDRQVSVDLESSMSGAGQVISLSTFASRSLKEHWPE